MVRDTIAPFNWNKLSEIAVTGHDVRTAVFLRKPASDTAPLALRNLAAEQSCKRLICSRVE